MALKMSKSDTEKVENKPKVEYPSLSIDISWAFGNSGNPQKTTADIQKALLVELENTEFLKTIKIEEIKGENGINNDFLVYAHWDLVNKSKESWPSVTSNVVLKSLPNDYLLKLNDLQITEREMSPLVISPGHKTKLSINFVLPHKIRHAVIKNKMVLNLMFSLFDEKLNRYIGSNLPCTIPL